MASWLTLFFATALLLPPLPVALGNSGPHVCLLFAASGLLFGLASLVDWQVAPSTLNAAFTAFFGILLASVALAAFHSGADQAIASFARVALFGISVYIFFFTAYAPAPAGQSFHAARRLFIFAVLSALFACVDFYYQFPAPAGYGPQFVWLESSVYRRAQGIFYEASTLGNFCAFFLLMIAVALSRPQREYPVSRKWLLLGGAPLFVALILSFSRGSVINVAVGLAVLVWLNRHRIRFARVGAVLGGCLLAGALVLIRVFPQIAALYWLRLTASGQFFFSAPDQILSGRVSSWSTLLQWVAANPWELLFGIGYKTLPYTDYLGAPLVADNMYFSILIETGIAGLAALIWLNASILRTAARSAGRGSFYGAWMLCFWSGEAVQMLSGDLLTYWRVLPVYFFVLALAVRE